MGSDDELERLRELLLGAGNQHIKQLKTRIENPDARAEDIAEVLAEASLLAQQADSEKLAQALQPSLAKAMVNTIEQNPETAANVLFPVIMPAIGRAISESMRQFTERVDMLLSRQLSIQALKWRLEAATSGVPYREIVLRETLQFQVQQVLLMQNGSGLLIQHLQVPGLSSTADGDVVSGMLWAIESFVRDSFTGDPQAGLNRVTMDNHVVYLEHGPEATLACVVRGVATTEFTEQMDQVVSQLHGLYHRQLRSYDGDPQSLAAAEPLLRSCLRSELRNDEQEDTQKPGFKKYLFLLGLIGLLGWLGWTGFQNYTERSAISTLVQTLDAQPGVVMIDSKKFNDHWTLRGLRDPDSVDPLSLLQQTHLDPERVSLALDPYLSLEPALRLPRLARELNVPDTVSLELDGNRLMLSGEGPLEWVDPIRFKRDLPARIESLDTSRLSASKESLAEFIRGTLALPTNTAIVFKGTHATIEARLPERQKDEVRAINATLDGLASVDVAQWFNEDSEQIDALLKSLEGRTFRFVEGTILDAPERTHIPAVVSQLQTLNKLIMSQGDRLDIILTGHTSPEGLEAENRQLRLQRANVIANEFRRLGIPADQLEVKEDTLDPAITEQLGIRNRRVELNMKINAHAN